MMSDSHNAANGISHTSNGQLNKGTRQQTGKQGEDAACTFLLEAGYFIKERNWRCRSGEIDIIAEHNGRLIFIEVRTRKQGGRFGTAAESVDHRKQKQVRETAQVYLRSTGLVNTSSRFDVVAVSISRESNAVIEYKHYEGAF
jgi:putative endonuclease